MLYLQWIIVSDNSQKTMYIDLFRKHGKQVKLWRQFEWELLCTSSREIWWVDITSHDSTWMYKSTNDFFLLKTKIYNRQIMQEILMILRMNEGWKQALLQLILFYPRWNSCNNILITLEITRQLNKSLIVEENPSCNCIQMITLQWIQEHEPSPNIYVTNRLVRAWSALTHII